MRGQFGLHRGPPTQRGWYLKPGSTRKVTYYFERDGQLVEGRTLSSVDRIPGHYSAAWARGESADRTP